VLVIPQWALAVGVSLIASAVLRDRASSAEGQVAPSALVRLCTAAAVTTALALASTLSALVLVVAGRDQRVAAGRWSTEELRLLVPVPESVGVAAGMLVTLLAFSSVRQTVLLLRDLTTAELVGRRLRPAVGRTIVIDDDIPDAYALSGLHGYVIVTTGMLRSLPGNERTVLLAHEASHVRNRHHLYVQLTDLAAAANPLLRPVAATVRHGVERWADEDAARVAGDRRLTAQAIARAGLARAHGAGVLGPSLAATGGRVADRATALLAGPPEPRRGAPAILLTLIAVAASVTVLTVNSVHDDFRHAEEVACTCQGEQAISRVC
jgi:beta-lactamase regulating signal transducer with metallopeptidase domain